jgi:large subunit ribosomal protein L29
MAKKTSIADLSAEELQAKVADLDRELFLLRNELALNRKLEKPHLLKAKRKEKARILTRITQQQKAKGVA